jgi:hypothetical protein
MFEAETRTVPAPAGAIRARILWPALGCPAVIAPRSGAPADAADSDATRTICVLVLTNTPTLTPQGAARYLRCVEWADRQASSGTGIRGSFPAAELAVRRVAEGRVEDKHGKALTFGANRQQRNGVTVSLSKYVRGFYGRDKIALRYLHEIRVSEAAAARLTKDQYHLFWSKDVPDQTSHSNEMNLLLKQFVPGRFHVPAGSQQDRELLENGYQFEYGALHAPYNAKDTTRVPTEVLHPVFLRRNLLPTIGIGHVTDTHVDIRNDVYARNLSRESAQVSKATGGKRIVFNNWNESFELVYNDAKSKSDLILMTGDLIDYGRGHIGNAAARDTLGRDPQYFKDRNWFLFYYLLATKGNYSRPVYTSLGNHDWRINPYPPFAPSTPDPIELIHNNLEFKVEEHKTVLKKVIEIAHGPGHDKWPAYADLARDLVEVFKSAWKSKGLIPSLLFGSPTNLDYEKLPTHTHVESIAWYLLLINPFLDYQFALPTGHQFLMLDFGEQEEVNNTVENHSQGPRAASCLTPLQQWQVEQLLRAPGKAKTIGIHTPPIGPRTSWSVNELKSGRKTYKLPADNPRYRNREGHFQEVRNQSLPLFALLPEGFSPWLAAQYGSFVHKDTRRWLIQKLHASSSVRVVVSGHIHRQGLLTVQPERMPLSPPAWNQRGKELSVLTVRSVEPEAVQKAKPPFATGDQSNVLGPVYVNTTSAGPRGFQYYDNGTYASVPPGFTLVQLMNDGTISSISGGPAYPVSAPAKVAMR